MTGRQAIGDLMINYFGELFCSSNPSIPFDLANLISPSITKVDLALLDTILSGEEILLTFKFMGSNKSPGLDELPVLFFKEY